MPAPLLLSLLGILAAAPALAQRVVPSAPVDPSDTLIVVPRRTAALPPGLAARMPAERFTATLVGYRADSVLLRSYHWGAAGPAGLRHPAGEETLAIPAHAIDHLVVPRHSALAQRVDAGIESAFWSAILGAVAGALLGGPDAARGFAGLGAVVGFIGGAASPDPNQGTRYQRVTLRVMPGAGAREP